jgi:hypothetical protein
MPNFVIIRPHGNLRHLLDEIKSVYLKKTNKTTSRSWTPATVLSSGKISCWIVLPHAKLPERRERH